MTLMDNEYKWLFSEAHVELQCCIAVVGQERPTSLNSAAPGLLPSRDTIEPRQLSVIQSSQNQCEKDWRVRSRSSSEIAVSI
jgi:hypothetical protein